MTVTQIGEFVVLPKLGEGSFCQTFGGEKPGSGKDFVLKRVKPALTSIPKIVERIRAQAISPPKVEHPLVAGLVTILIDGDAYWLVREAAKGEPLDAYLKKGATRSPAVVLPPFCDLLDAFGAAHRRGFFHGNLKPSNVWIEAAGRYRVTDFEMSRIFGVTGQARDLLGAPEYRAPEHANGEDLDARSDIYSLGIVLQQILTGKLQARSGSKGLAPDVAAVLERATAASREDRFRTALEFREALQQCVVVSAPVAELPVTAARPPAPVAAPLLAGLEDRTSSGADSSSAKLRWAAAGLAAAMALGWVVWRTSGEEKTASAKSVAAMPQVSLPVAEPKPAEPAGKNAAKDSAKTQTQANNVKPQTPMPQQTQQTQQVQQAQQQTQQAAPAREAPKQFVWNQPQRPQPQAGAPALPASDPNVAIGHAPAPPPTAGNEVRVLPPPPAPEPAPAPVTQPAQQPRAAGKAVGARLLRGGSPTYPAFAKQMRISGVVKLEIQIASDGRVTGARALAGHPVLAASAVEAARKWSYSPATLDGQPIASSTQVDISFTSR